MNIFIIPSWYPSAHFPVSGSFLVKQLQQLASHYADLNIGVSNWGQNRLDLALQAKHHLFNLKKIFTANTKPYKEVLQQNHVVYYHPTFSWTQHIAKGNMEGIIKANLANLKAFEADFGPVDLIHAHTGRPAGIVAKELSHRVKLPYAITEHMGPFPDSFSITKHGDLKPELKLAYAHSVVNIAESEFQKQMMQTHRIRNVRVVSNFVNETYFTPCLASANLNQSFRFFSLGYIHPKKGFDTLLHAFKIVAEQRADVSLTIGGVGEYLSTYQKLATNLNIADKIEWLGEINKEEALQQYQTCNAFVLASQYEALGIVFIEAIACGKPIIATRCGGPETTVNQTNGLLVERNNPEELAEAMLSMMEHTNKYDSHSIRQDFMNRFSSKAVMPQLYSLYKDIISRHS
ncbi:glycosyltransferase [Pontibacter rugosus]|uniref:Glycosyltransferase n=1 Tax=Pontibacter rugosus TaxID=1745966 RepID=A0ABW3SU56_9BACT